MGIVDGAALAAGKAAQRPVPLGSSGLLPYGLPPQLSESFNFAAQGLPAPGRVGVLARQWTPFCFSSVPAGQTCSPNFW